jgi:hypothetical protein
MVFDIEPVIFPPGKVGGEFVCQVLVAGLLTQLDAGAPCNGKMFRCGLRFDTEEEAEKIPVGFDSEETFAGMDKNRNVADGVRVEVMEFKPVIIQKAAEARTRGEGQSPFGKMVKCDDFVNIFVAEPIELFRFKCVSHRYTADNNSMHFKQNNPLVCRVSARYNHGSTGSK